LTGEDEDIVDDGPSWMDGLKERFPEKGVSFFGTFILAMVIGFLLATSGQLTLAMIVFLVAIVSIIAMLFTPSPAVKAKREAHEAPPDEGGEDEEGKEETDVTRPDLLVDDEPAPTSGLRDIPAPPPEPPPLEEILVDVEDDETSSDEEKAPAGEGDVWVE
jgi:hypothetical protein